MGEKEQRRKEEKEKEEGTRGGGGRAGKDKMKEMIKGIKRGRDDTKPERENIREEEDE